MEQAKKKTGTDFSHFIEGLENRFSSTHLLLFIGLSQSILMTTFSRLMIYFLSPLLLILLPLHHRHFLCLQHIFTFFLFPLSSYFHVLFPFHSFVILFCTTTTTLPTYMPPTERKKCTHISWPPLCAPFNLAVSALHSKHPLLPAPPTPSVYTPIPAPAFCSIMRSVRVLLRFAVC